MKKIIILTLTAYTVISILSCQNTGKTEVQEGKAQSEVTPHEEGESNMVSLTEEQIHSTGIELGQIERKELTNSIRANGILTVPNQNKAFVVPLFSGVVKTLHVQPGNFVKQGQVIATIVNPELLQLQQQLHQLNTQIGMAEIEVKRQKELVEGNAAPLKKLQQAETELATLKSQRSGVQKQLSGIGATQTYSSSIAIKAPISGTISKVNAQLGSNVDVNTPIAEIVNNTQLHLDMFVYEKDLPKIKAGQLIHFTITNNAGKEYDASIYSIGTAFESGTKTIPVHAKVLGNKTGLIDGMNITALVSLNKSTVPAVPIDAIVNYHGVDYIFVMENHPSERADTIAPKKDSHGHSTLETDTHAQGEEINFIRVPVAKGTTDVGYCEITVLTQIPENAKIVTKGAFFLLAKMTDTGGGHEH